MDRSVEHSRRITEIGWRDGWNCPCCGIGMIPPGMEIEFEFPVPEWNNVMLVTTDEAYSVLNHNADGLICHRCYAVKKEIAEARQ